MSAVISHCYHFNVTQELWNTKKWTELPLVALDIETSGQYPYVSHICEIAAVKSVNGQMGETFSQLIKPPEPMSDFVIGIHGISNEMVADAPSVEQVLPQFMEFLGDDICIGHHIPFDLTFLSAGCDQLELKVPKANAICTSLLSRNLVKDTPNHRLQTLIDKFGIYRENAHRALDDSKACLEVFFELVSKIKEPNFQEIERAQRHSLRWQDFSMKLKSLKSSIFKKLYEAQLQSKSIEFCYSGGSRRGQPRKASIKGIVLNPTGQYLVADDGSEKPKRFYLDKITDVEILF